MKIKILLMMLALIFIAFQPSFVCAEISEGAVSPWAMCQMKAAIQDYFKSYVEEDIQKSLLTGGYGATSIRLDVADKAYVLRIINELETSERVNAELFAMKNAADIGVAPAVHWMSDDGYAILMDYIPGRTLNIECGKNPEIVKRVADLLRKVHSLPKNLFNAPSFEEHMENFYSKYSVGSQDPDSWGIAISIIREGCLELQKLQSPSLNTHGDLNPRNILMSLEALYFIDWSEGMYTEPFHDLGYFAVLMDYSPSDEVLLLESYLERTPDINEKKRFLIAKKMQFGRLALGGLFIGNILGSMNQEVDDVPQKLEEWSYYVNAFANNNTNLTSQFFLNLAQVAIKCANAIDLFKPLEE